MSNLLNADLFRLKKSRIFGVFAVIIFLTSAAVSIYVCCNGGKWNDIFFYYYIFAEILIIPSFISLFVGAEYSERLIQRKLTRGKQYSEIYISLFIICAVVVIIMWLLYAVMAFVVGRLILNLSVERLYFERIIIMCFIQISLCSIMMCISMSLSKRAISVLVCIGVCVLMMAISIRINMIGYNSLHGNLLEILRRFMPTGQMISYIEKSHHCAEEFVNAIFCSVILTVTTTALGIFIFSKKEIK